MFFPVGEGWRGHFELWFPPAKAGASGQGMLIGIEHPLIQLSIWSEAAAAQKNSIWGWELCLE